MTRAARGEIVNWLKEVAASRGRSCDVKVCMGFTVVVHHGGDFVKDSVMRMDKNLTCISWDSHALEMGTYALEHKCEVDFYVEHTVVSEPMLLDASTLLIGNRGGEGEKLDSGRVGGLDGVGDKNNVEGEL
ncbi:hypothetical protein SESBI_05098 [Sesbania bispinosa]|nr:hypothetical protein SESBI_05098 [Sesbania bispinosa]